MYGKLQQYMMSFPWYAHNVLAVLTHKSNLANPYNYFGQVVWLGKGIGESVWRVTRQLHNHDS
jgi:hypothetical protein